MISALSYLARLSRAGFVLAREGVLALPDPAPLPLPAQTALKLARTIERPTLSSTERRLATALTRLGPAYVKLGQFLATRPDVVGVALARDLEVASGQDGAVPAGRGRDRGRGCAGQAVARDVRLVRTGRRRGLDRAGAPGRGRDCLKAASPSP